MAKVKVVGILSRYVGGERELQAEAGKSIEELLVRLGIPSAMVGIVLVNGRQVEKSYVIGEGDEIKLIPLIGGG